MWHVCTPAGLSFKVKTTPKSCVNTQLHLGEIQDGWGFASELDNWCCQIIFIKSMMEFIRSWHLFQVASIYSLFSAWLWISHNVPVKFRTNYRRKFLLATIWVLGTELIVSLGRKCLYLLSLLIGHYSHSFWWMACISSRSQFLQRVAFCDG